MSQSAFYLSGIQQVGIGNPDMAATWAFYRRHFGFDVRVFEEEAEANLMLPYTGGQPQKRRAVLSLNMNGGGGLEIWQYTDRELIWPAAPVRPGDLGIHSLKIKTSNIARAYAYCQEQQLDLLGEPQKSPGAAAHFLLRDLHGNVVEIVESGYWYARKPGLFGGVAGVAIGVSDLALSQKFYAELLGFDRVLYQEEGEFADYRQWLAAPARYRRVLLERSTPYAGAFAALLGPAQIELVQALDYPPRKLYAGRFWGDPGYIHLCFDLNGMAAFKAHCADLGHPFTVDSANSFDMGEAAGRFAYLEDPDGTLLEFVETHKVPIAKKWGWYLNLQKRRPGQALPRWMINSLRYSRVKD